MAADHNILVPLQSRLIYKLLTNNLLAETFRAHLTDTQGIALRIIRMWEGRRWNWWRRWEIVAGCAVVWWISLICCSNLDSSLWLVTNDLYFGLNILLRWLRCLYNRNYCWFESYNETVVALLQLLYYVWWHAHKAWIAYIGLGFCLGFCWRRSKNVSVSIRSRFVGGRHAHPLKEI